MLSCVSPGIRFSCLLVSDLHGHACVLYIANPCGDLIIVVSVSLCGAANLGS